MYKLDKEIYDPKILDFEAMQILAHDLISCFKADELSEDEIKMCMVLNALLSHPEKSLTLDQILDSCKMLLSTDEAVDLIRKVAHTTVTIDFRRVSPEGTVIVTDLFPMYEEVTIDPDTYEMSFRYISQGYSAQYLSLEVVERLGDGLDYRQAIEDLLVRK